MADYGHVVTWTGVRQGREKLSLEVFTEAIDFYEKAQANNLIENYNIILFEPAGGTAPVGAISAWGSQDQMAAFERNEDRQRLQAKAGLVVEGLAVRRATRGDTVLQGVGLFTEVINSL